MAIDWINCVRSDIKDIQPIGISASTLIIEDILARSDGFSMEQFGCYDILLTSLHIKESFFRISRIERRKEM